MTSSALGTAPFVLIDDQRPGGRAFLHSEPAGIVETRDPAEVQACLRSLDGRSAAGFIAYEAGHALERKLAPLARSPADGEPPLLWFGLFDRIQEVDVGVLLPDPAGAWAAPPRPLIERSAYEARVETVRRHIEAGDVYQVNLTFPAEVKVAGNPLALYATIRRRARAGHGAIAFTGAHWILSFSPELFFEIEGRRITARPMKGTAPRGADPQSDREAARALVEDPKQRAENLMIVDLLRNDLSRVSKPGTVEVPALFAVETYPTVHQMTSTVTAVLEDGRSAIDLIEAIFPCGSITGAPKIRAMEIIGGIEAGPRGVYTGSIGRVAPGGEAAFNVAIRTLVVPAGGGTALLGLGSGIVADSCARDEWLECLAKGAFVADPERSFDLVETMRFDPREGMPDLERHLGRLKRSADALGFAFDRHHARNELQAATFRMPGLGKVRLMLSPSGAIAIEIRPLEPPPKEPVEVAIGRRPVPAEDFRLAHKTSDRAFYDDARSSSGAFEILFADEAGFVTEGSFTSLFVERRGRLVTPPLSRGLLPGVLRERLIEEGRAIEGDLVEADLLGGFLIGNAARGLIRARLGS
ncbi:aminodeoxychorismate synthase component I [Allosphingosinicella sp.]|jgi:para-aminobenzoate synthetase/4-amino-4-deoxychorismate lyase|uniref:aminodeoxychorismate synthase component I n=1 Tax=Allosphingosinicella sp. TaxID=2823234 RepID=UPI002F1243F2